MLTCHQGNMSCGQSRAHFALLGEMHFCTVGVAARGGGGGMHFCRVGVAVHGMSAYSPVDLAKIGWAFAADFTLHVRVTYSINSSNGPPARNSQTGHCHTQKLSKAELREVAYHHIGQ